MHVRKPRYLAWIALPAVIALPHAMNGCAVAVNEPVAQSFDSAVFETGSTGTYVRIVDVGSALCVVTATRDGRHFVYDAGGIDQACLKAVREIVGDGNIDLLVISHSDGEHMQDVPELLDKFTVGEIWWTEYRRPQLSYRRVVRAIAAAEQAGARVRSLRTEPLSPGDRFRLGDASVTFVAGGALWRGNEELDEETLAKAVSLVVRLDYGDSSLLLTGDTIGRLASWPDDQCGYAEAEMVKTQAQALAVNVMLAPNHGANTAGSRCLVEAVGPDWVIFTAGHGKGNPDARAVQRYLQAGLPADRLLRTDRSDDEGGGEWPSGVSSGCHDQPGDDDIEILMPDRGPPVVRYLRANDVCVIMK